MTANYPSDPRQIEPTLSLYQATTEVDRKILRRDKVGLALAVRREVPKLTVASM